MFADILLYFVVLLFVYAIIGKTIVVRRVAPPAIVVSEESIKIHPAKASKKQVQSVKVVCPVLSHWDTLI